MAATGYEEFLASKDRVVAPVGVAVAAADVHPMLYPFQRDLVVWAVGKGRACLFADCGLGKTLMQLEWARIVMERTGGSRALILAPLCVAKQTAREGGKIDLPVTVCRTQADVCDGINITNYEMLDHFEPAAFDAVVLDESSILKNFAGKTRTAILDAFRETPYRLACTATPCPNDIAELANHVEFMGLMTREEMLATYFVHDDEGWRMKGHATEAFWRWMATWAMTLRAPSDLGYDDAGFELPPLNVHDVVIHRHDPTPGHLFAMPLKGVGERAATRRATIDDRVAAAADLINASDEQWIVWCGLNDEAKAICDAVPDAVEIRGTDKIEIKEDRTQDFQDGGRRVLVTKPKISGFGLNLQNCHNMAFVGMGDSYEAYYQCVRRCWRFGQEHPVNVHIVITSLEGVIVDNVRRKEAEATKMATNILAHVRDHEQEELAHTTRQQDDYTRKTASGVGWTFHLGDCVEVVRDQVADGSVGLSVFSPPFAALYTYSNSKRDLGNARDNGEFFGHMGYLVPELLRSTMPGRNCCVHVAQIPARLVTDGFIGLTDFRAEVVKCFRDGGWVYHGEVCIDKDPQAQAIRTKSKCLLFRQGKKDSSWLRPALADYILVFRKPGENPEPIRALYDGAVNPGGWVDNEQWIEWARPIWYGIRESDTLRVAEARHDDDERHICPLQLGTIERCIALWSAPGDLVLSPFGGIGSEGYQAVKMGRRAVLAELKASYWRVGVKNLRKAERDARAGHLF